MFSSEKYEIAKKILSTCYSLQFWEYTNDMELIADHDGQAEFMDRLITLNGMKDFLIEYAKQDSCPPCEFTDDLGIVIGFVFSKNNKKTDRIILMGPTFSNDKSLNRLQADLELRNLSVISRKYMFEQFKDYPILPLNVFNQYLLMLHCSICDEKLKLQEIFHKNFYHKKSDDITTKKDKSVTAFHDTLNQYDNTKVSLKKLQEASYKLSEDISREHAGVSGFEQQLIAAVEQGNIGLLHFLTEGEKVSSGIKTQLSSDLQRNKYGSISLLTLCSRAAIRGGLSASISYSLMDTYTLAIDNCGTSIDLRNINDAIFADYITRVHDAKKNNNISTPIRTCIDYINLHVQDKINIKDLSKISGYSDYYLSHKFKEEIGISINQYIQNQKLETAKMLLATEHTSVTQVAEALNFCSQSYFSTLFQKKYGMSPSKYQESM